MHTNLRSDLTNTCELCLNSVELTVCTGIQVHTDQCHWIKKDCVVLKNSFVFEDYANTSMEYDTLLLLNQCCGHLFPKFFYQCSSVYFFLVAEHHHLS